MSDYLQFDGNDTLIAAKGGTAHFFPSGGPVSMTVRFRTSHTASRGIIWSDVDGDGVEYYVDINHASAGAGRLRFSGWDGASTFFVKTHNVNLADGQWHTVTVVKESASLYRWFVDGVQVGSDDTTDIGAGAYSGDRFFGCYLNGDLRYTGDIAWAAAHDKAISAAESSAMHGGGSPLNVSGAECVLYPGGPAAAAGMGGDYMAAFFKGDLSGHTARTDTGFASFPTAVSDGGPANLSLTNLSDGRAFVRVGRIIQPGAAASSDEVIREIGNAFELPGGGYGLLYSGHPSGSPGLVQVHLATSEDGETWTKEGVVFSRATHGIYTEDPYVLAEPHAGKLWAACESKGTTDDATNQAGIALFSSVDGLTWTLENDDILPVGAGGSFEAQDVSSPVLFKEGETFYLLYEGRITTDIGRIGLATASAPDGVWTKSGSNPIFSGTSSRWSEESVVPDDIVKIQGRYYMLLHCFGPAEGEIAYRCGIITATSLTGPWTDIDENPLTGEMCNTLMRATYDPTVLFGVDESGSHQYSIKKYAIYGATPSTPAPGEGPTASTPQYQQVSGSTSSVSFVLSSDSDMDENSVGNPEDPFSIEIEGEPVTGVSLLSSDVIDGDMYVVLGIDHLLPPGEYSVVLAADPTERPKDMDGDEMAAGSLGTFEVEEVPSEPGTVSSVQLGFFPAVGLGLGFD